MPMIPRPALGGDTIAKGLLCGAGLSYAPENCGHRSPCPPALTPVAPPVTYLLLAFVFFVFFKQNAVDWVPMLLVASRSLPLASAGTRHRHTVAETWHGTVFFPGISAHRHGRGACPCHWQYTDQHVLAPSISGYKAQQGACSWHQWGTRHGMVLAPGITGHKARQSVCPSTFSFCAVHFTCPNLSLAKAMAHGKNFLLKKPESPSSRCCDFSYIANLYHLFVSQLMVWLFNRFAL